MWGTGVGGGGGVGNLESVGHTSVGHTSVGHTSVGRVGKDGNEGILGARIVVSADTAGTMVVLGAVLGVLGVEDWQRVRESGVSGVSKKISGGVHASVDTSAVGHTSVGATGDTVGVHASVGEG